MSIARFTPPFCTSLERGNVRNNFRQIYPRFFSRRIIAPAILCSIYSGKEKPEEQSQFPRRSIFHGASGRKRGSVLHKRHWRRDQTRPTIAAPTKRRNTTSTFLRLIRIGFTKRRPFETSRGEAREKGEHGDANLLR